MTQEKYDLVFCGQLIPGFELASVRKSIQQLFRIDDAKVDVLFSGREIPLKKGLAADVADKYRVAIEKAGARVSITVCADSPVLTAIAPVGETVEDKNSQVAGTSKSASLRRFEVPAYSTELGAQPYAPPAPAKEIVAPAFEVAALGEAMLPRAYQQTEAAVVVNTSAYSIAPQQGRLVQPEELRREETVHIEELRVSIAPVGSELITADERPKVVAVSVDTSALSLAQVGERLGAPAKSAPAAPNVDHIKLMS